MIDISIQKLLSGRGKRDKSKKRSSEDGSSEESSLPLHCWRAFAIPASETANIHNPRGRTLQQMIANLRGKFTESALPDPGEAPVRFALLSRHARGDTEKAAELLFMIQNAIDGVVERYVPSRKLLGAENKEKTTCYLDSILFAMFARTEFFDGILYSIYDDVPRQNLIVLVRLWVNMLRSGMLIPTDIMWLLQGALAECGWTDAKRKRQQDASEAFTFIAEKLDLPLVTLKMAIFHDGKEDVSNDHRFINERLLEVAIPPPRADDEPILLEDCLEQYFNNHVEVNRYLERRNTVNSLSSADTLIKEGTSHVETVELDGPEDRPLTRRNDLNVASRPELPNTSLSSPELARIRASSIVRRRFIPAVDERTTEDATQDSVMHHTRSRKGSVRKEVMIPAWQMFSLIPWYTRNTNAFQTAAHFSSQRPILGICLKRYSVLPDGTSIRLDTKVDVPIEIALPHFINDDSLTEDAPLYGQFKLRLQSVVCHQGNSVDSGHYIALVRGTAGTPGLAPDGHTLSNDSGSTSNNDHHDHWLRFDDLAEERITLVDIEQALRDESPYILFYQITPLDDDANLSGPPPYSGSDDDTKPPYPSLGALKSNSEVLEYPLDPKPIPGTADSLKKGWTVSTDNSRPATSGAADQSKLDHSSTASTNETPRMLRSSQSFEGRLSTALTYLSRKKSTDGDIDKENNGVGTTLPSFETPRSKTKDALPRRQSDELDRNRNRIALKKHSKLLPPERQCLVM